MAAFLPLLATSLNVVSQGLSFFGNRRLARQTRREGAAMAQDAIDRGEFAAEQYQRDLSRLLGLQRTQLAGQGVDVTFGSAAQLARQTQAIGEADIEQIRENALREAYALRRGFNNQAQSIRQSSYGNLGSAFASLAQLGANAWDVYNRRSMKVGGTGNTMAGKLGKLPTMGG